MVDKAGKINVFLQKQLSKKGINEVSAVEAAKWLDKAEILKDSKSRRGRPLRDLLRANKIRNSQQRNGRFWYILKGE